MKYQNVRFIFFRKFDCNFGGDQTIGNSLKRKSLIGIRVLYCIYFPVHLKGEKTARDERVSLQGSLEKDTN